MKSCHIFLFLIFSIIYSDLPAQKVQIADLNYISPVPGSKYIMPKNNIAFRQGDPLEQESIKSFIIEVRNQSDELIMGKNILSDDNRTLIFIPEKPFNLGSKIFVKLNPGLRTTTGKTINPIEFDFQITQQLIDVDEAFINNYLSDNNVVIQKPANKYSKQNKLVDNNYPEGYAYPDVLFNESTFEGYYFYCPYNEWALFPDTDPFINIVDKHGIPVFYQKFGSRTYDLRPQPGGYISFYTSEPAWGHILMDSSYSIQDTLKIGNGYYFTDFHELRYFETGHYFVMTFDPQLVDMSLIVPGGNPAAIVSGLVVQEIDSNDNVIFQWRSWDHFEITETGPEVDLTAESIDYVHGNTIDVESDTSLLISSRNFHEITKIHRNTGEIIWRWGGSQNQFEFINDTLGFSRQHDCRRNQNGHITLYDNGVFHPEPVFSSALEYDIDPLNMTATLVNRYRHNPDIYGRAMGNAFWTPDESIVVGWGSSFRTITEFDINGDIIYELECEGMSYRAYRHPWKTTRFNLEKDTLDFDSIWMESQLTISFNVINNKDGDLVLTSYHSHSENFAIENEFPITITANSVDSIQIKFTPNSAGAFEDIITLNADINTEELVQRIAQQVIVIGYATEEQGVEEKIMMNFMVHPNPANDLINIISNSSAKIISIEVFNEIGEQTYSEKYSGFSEVKISTDVWQPGMYLVKISDDKNQISSYKILKR